MSKELFCRNITLDTSFFESQNFLAGSKLKELSDIHKKYNIGLFTTDIFYREVLARFEKNIKQAVENTKKPKDQLKSSARVLRNFKGFDSYFNLPTINIKELCDKFKNELDSWIKENEVEIIPTFHLNIKEVFEDYFNNAPPFKEGEKKHEFPDAFSLKAIIEYFKSKKDKTYILTSDNDILEYESSISKSVKESSELFDLIIRTTTEERIEKTIALIESAFHRTKSKLEKDTKEIIESAIEDEVGSTYMLDDLEIDSVNHVDLGDITFDKFSILKLNIDDNEAKLECEIKISFEVSFSAFDYSEAHYDSEDKIWHFVNTNDFSIEDEYDITVQLTAEFDLEEEYCEFEVEDIENGEKLDVFNSFKRWQ